MKTGVVSIRIVRGDKVFHVHGDGAGREGVWLAEGQVEGIYDAPVKVTYKSGAFQVGSKYKGKRRTHRKLNLGFHIKETLNSWEFNDSAFRQMFQWELDPWDTDRTPTTIEVETTLSGTRKLDVFLADVPQFEAAIDPIQNQFGNVIMPLIAPDPDWYEDDYTATFSSTAGSASGTITVSNPCDQPAYHRMVLTPANWTLPDPSWEGAPAERTPGGADAARTVSGVTIPVGAGAGAVADWDRSQLAFRDANNTNLQAQIGSNCFLLYPIPPQTPATPLPIGYTSAPAGGAMAQVEVPRRWSRPWGMELQSDISYLPPLGTITFALTGTWSAEIPSDATKIDVVMLGGGGGGSSSGLYPETGGSAATWSKTTLVRGSNIPASTTVLYGTIGKGGAGGKKDPWVRVAGADGESSTCYADGMTTIVAAGGKGSGRTGFAKGAGTGNTTFNGVTYTGSVEQDKYGAPGVIPGGGGSGGRPWTSGADGARGQVWLRFYT